MRKLLIGLLFALSLLGSAHAFWQSRDSNYNVAIGGAPPPSFALTWKSSAVTPTSSGSGTVDFGTMTYGSGCTRVVVVNFSYNTSVSAVTIGGSSLSQIASSSIAFGGLQIDAWITSGSPSGSSDDVQTTYSFSYGYYSSVSLFCIVTTTPTPGTPATNTGNGVSSISVTATIPSGGGALVATGATAGTTVSSFTNATQDNVQSDPPTNDIHFYSAHTTSTGSVSVTANYAGSDDVGIIVIPFSP